MKEFNLKRLYIMTLLKRQNCGYGKRSDVKRVKNGRRYNYERIVRGRFGGTVWYFDSELYIMFIDMCTKNGNFPDYYLSH